ncbi:MAG: cytochrome c oxidase subunit I, partial [Bdellovibrionaceae bacterium]|nr:cytochrome c oxidase subunit I [Pseudobdellovibrionaceae bacterium]
MGSAAPGENYLNHEKGLKSWLTTLDHKRIGVMYMITVLVFFAMGGFAAIMLRTELAAPGPGVLGE